MNNQQTTRNIAVIGLSCLFPGAKTPAEFWQNLTNGVDSTSVAASEHFGADPAIYYDPERRKVDTTYALRGGYVSASIDIPEGMDKASGWSLYVAQEALRDSGYLNRQDVLARCGLILGNLSFPTQESHRLVSKIYDTALEKTVGELTNAEHFRLLRDYNGAKSETALLAPASVVAKTLALGGAHFCVDAACASSLYTVGLACEYLVAGKADLMLAGAVSAADPLFVNMGFTRFGAYPEKGQSRPLDTESGGLVSGEGAGLLVLKRYEDAIRDGDHIYAIIDGVGLSNDGKGKHPLTPNSRGQMLAFQRAYAGGIDPSTVQYVECHASGTPLGDKTELGSMDAFFGANQNVPMIGSVKANHGHLLTVAGVASILKVILSMQNNLIPVSIGVENPLTTRHFGAAQIVKQNTPWTQAQKVGGINAFGFGGVSAHLVLRTPQPSDQPQHAIQQARGNARMAIVGMDVHFGECEGLEAFAQTLYDGAQHFTPLPAKRWKGLAEDAPLGAYIDQFDIDFKRFKFPPKEDDQPTPQHLLLLKTADNAVRDANLQEGSNVIVIVALGVELSLHQYRSRLDLSWQVKDSLQQAGITLNTDADQLADVVKNAINPTAQVNQYISYIGNIVSSRVSALWDFSGSAFTLSSGENSVYKALEVAQLLLANDSLDAVVIGAVDLAGGVENVVLRRQEHPLNTGAPTLSFDQNANGWLVGEGAGAVVLKRADKAPAQDVYAVIESVAIANGTDANAIAHAAQNALNSANVTPQQIGYLEASASGIEAQDHAEILGLTHIYQFEPTNDTQDLPTALGSVKANIGHTGAAAGIASLIKSALCLQQRFIPAVQNWTAPKFPEAWQHSAFYVAQESRTWFSNNYQPRYAAISSIGEDGNAAHVILSDAGVERAESNAQNSYLKRRNFHLFPLSANDEAGLISKLQQLDAALDSEESLASIAAKTFAAFSKARYTVAIVGGKHDALKREIQLAYKGIPAAFQANGDWQTPLGSAFTTQPLGEQGKIAFMYPGAFNSYPDLGRDWMHLFPASHDYLRTHTQDAGRRASDHLLYPRSLNAPTRADVRASRARLASYPSAMMESGITFALLYTYTMREIFKIRPDAAFGYSLGEGSMLWGMDVWQNGDEASRVLHTSNLFTTRLVGRKDAIREAWGLPANTDDDFWSSYVLTANPAAVYAEIARESHVYLTHVNTPSEVVIAGDPAACERIIERLGCPSIRAPFDTVTHNEAMISEYGEFYRMHDHPVDTSSSAGVTFYSAADYQAFQLDRALIARNISRVSCKPVDFPRLISRAYNDGSRIFIELGAGATCARWISDTLASQNLPHVAVAVDNLRLDDHTALVKLLAKLVSHHTPMDISVLYQEITPLSDEKQILRTIVLGGERVQDVILTEENKRRFTASGKQPAYAPSYNTPVSAAQPIQTYAAPQTPSSHDALLETRRSGLRALAGDIRTQLGNPETATMVTAPIIEPIAQPIQPQKPAIPAARYTPSPAIFSHTALDQFARGSIKACFGEEYAIYDNKRAPRVPNTDLMLLSRIVEVDATRLITKVGSQMVAEYDVPADMWFYVDNAYPFTPYSMLMEMALQPCGVLSAFMGPTLPFPEIDFYFRNLDGQGKLLREVDLRGRTLVNRVKLLSSTVLQGIIIQKYSFDMQLDGESFYVGSSTFGYFTLQAFENQAGLDRGAPPTKWHEANPQAPLNTVIGDRHTGNPYPHMLPEGRLAFVDQAWVNINGGNYGQGYVYATSNVTPRDWFFKCHFHQDPVMPGSLGLETITQAIQTYALEANLTAGFQSPRFGHVESEMVWKYRGQVLGDSSAVDVEISIKQIEKVDGRVHIYADASLWKGELRIYEFKNVTVSISEAN